MSRSVLLPALAGLLFFPSLAHAQSSLFPPRTTLSDGTQAALSANLAWDVSHLATDGEADRHADDWRRQEIGLVVRKPDAYDLQVFYDLHNKMWLGVVVGLPTASLLPGGSGRLEVGNIKLAAGLEGIATTRHMPLMESAAATQVFHPMVRGGINWTQTSDRWLLDIGAFGRDIDGFYQGTTMLVRAAWTAGNTRGAHGHLGLSLSRDTPRHSADTGLPDGGTVRWASRGVASLLPDRLADSGLLPGVAHVHRQNLQGMWINGPYWLQGEYFAQQTQRDHGLPDYRGHGGYLTAGWVLGGPSRRIVQGMLFQPAVSSGQTTAELVVRAGTVDLDDAGIHGGQLREWTWGGNLYLGPHLKLQANLSQMHLRRAGVHQHTRALQLRSQFFF